MMKLKQKHLFLGIGVFLAMFCSLIVPSSLVFASDDEPKCSTSVLPDSFCKTDDQGNGVFKLLNLVVTILAAGVGIVAVGGLVYAALLYTSARDDAGQVKKSKEIITNVVIGIVAFALMWSFLQFLIPGGVFN